MDLSRMLDAWAKSLSVEGLTMTSAVVCPDGTGEIEVMVSGRITGEYRTGQAPRYLFALDGSPVRKRTAKGVTANVRRAWGESQKQLDTAAS